jgi:hypothetical protein
LFLKGIHSDLHQLPVLTSTGFRYWLLFIDDYLWYFWIYLLWKKLETFDAFTQLKAMVEKEFDKSFLCLHNNKGSEFIGVKWDTFFAQHIIWRKHTVKALVQQNDVAERLNRTLKELLVAMLNGARLPACFWGEGLNYLRHVIVRSLSSPIPPGTTPYEMVHKCKPGYSPLRVFGCRTWAHIQRKERKSLQDHNKLCIFLGCPKDFKGWKLWDLSANGWRGGIIVSRDVIWNKDEFPGLLSVAHNTIPERFGRRVEPGDTERSPDEEEVSDLTDLEGVTIPLLFKPAVPRFDSDSSSSSSTSLSTASPTPSSPRTPLHTPLDEWPALSPPSALHPPMRVEQWPVWRSGTLPVPAAPALPHASTPNPTADTPGPRCSAHSKVGVAHPPNWFDATTRLKGKVRGVPVVSYCEHGVRLTARPRTQMPAPSREPSVGPSNKAPPMPNVEEEEEAAPEASREPPIDDDDKDIYAQPQARLARCLALDGVLEPPSNVRALLAQGLCSIYYNNDDDDEYIKLALMAL